MMQNVINHILYKIKQSLAVCTLTVSKLGKIKPLYKTIYFKMILHMTLQWQLKCINYSVILKMASHISALREGYLCKYLGENDRVIKRFRRIILCRSHASGHLANGIRHTGTSTASHPVSKWEMKIIGSARSISVGVMEVCCSLDIVLGLRWTFWHILYTHVCTH